MYNLLEHGTIQFEPADESKGCAKGGRGCRPASHLIRLDMDQFSQQCAKVQLKRVGHALMIAGVVIAGLLAACGSREINHGKPPFEQVGMASYYARSLHGRQTASGEKYNENALTAAHPRLPFGTRLKVTNLKTGRTVEVRVNDRGPFVRRRVIDLSYAAARKLGMLQDGVARVKIRILAQD
jgi:rare lipoprotein A